MYSAHHCKPGFCSHFPWCWRSCTSLKRFPKIRQFRENFLVPTLWKKWKCCPFSITFCIIFQEARPAVSLGCFSSSTAEQCGTHMKGFKEANQWNKRGEMRCLGVSSHSYLNTLQDGRAFSASAFWRNITHAHIMFSLVLSCHERSIT